MLSMTKPVVLNRGRQ